MSLLGMRLICDFTVASSTTSRFAISLFDEPADDRGCEEGVAGGDGAEAGEGMELL